MFATLGRGLLEEVVMLFCACNYEIFCEMRTHGERLGTVGFFDAGPRSETRGKQVTSCPGCGQKLGLHMLRAQKKISA